MTKRLSPDPDLEELIRKLNASARGTGEAAEAARDPEEPAAEPATESRWGLPPATEDGATWLDELLSRAREALASDLLLVVDSPPVARVNGALLPLGTRALTRDGSALLCACLVPGERREKLGASGSVDFSLHRAGIGGLRINVHRQSGGWAAAVRLLPAGVPDLAALGLPETFGRFAELDRGLVLVTGPAGSGKSTTLAAIVRRILEKRRVHLITIEDPVEYVHAHAGSVVEHIEVERDVPSFAVALRSVLRQDPDVILVGEMRDLESMSLAISAAETGHLVLSTLHTPDCAQTVHRILDSYPPEQIDALRAQLATSLAAVISQRLLPRADGAGRAPAVEVLIATYAVRNLIRTGRIEQIASQITLERQAGMVAFDTSLAELVRRGVVTLEEARAWARSPADLRR